MDDDAREIRLLSAMLRPEGYRLFAALNGEEGFKRALEHPPALVLLDLNMPGMDGQATCKLFKATSQLSAIPIIFLTGSGLLDDKLRAFSHGAVDYITKPFSAQEVSARVRVHLRLRQPIVEESAMASADKPSANAMDGGAPSNTTTPYQDAGKRMVREAQAMLLRDLGATLNLADLAHTAGTNERRLT